MWDLCIQICWPSQISDLLWRCPTELALDHFGIEAHGFWASPIQKNISHCNPRVFLNHQQPSCSEHHGCWIPPRWSTSMGPSLKERCCDPMPNLVNRYFKVNDLHYPQFRSSKILCSILCVGSGSFPTYDLTGMAKLFEFQNGNSSLN